MKRFLIITLSAICLFSTLSFAGSVNGKLGTAYSNDPEKWGFNFDLSFYKELDPYFHLGFSPAFYWAKWRDNLKNITTESGIDGSKVKDTDAYLIPALVSAKVRFVDLQDDLHGLMPYATVGLGYSSMILSYENTNGKNKVNFFGGFTWQVMVGGAFSPSKSSKVEFLFELGYRSAPVKNSDDIEIDMSGLVFNIGVSYPY